MAAGPGYREKVSNVPGRIGSLYSQSLAIMSREIKHLSDMSRRDKLPSGPAKDLRDYVKLLGEMKNAHEKIEAEKAAAAKASGKGLSDAALLEAVTRAGSPTVSPATTAATVTTASNVPSQDKP